jgi:mRNA interferase YafQ
MVKPYPVVTTPEFDADMERLAKLDYDLSEIKQVMRTLSDRQPLPERYDDHQLLGEWRDYNGAYISNDPVWILIYRYTAGRKVRFARTGSLRELYPRGRTKKKQ